MQKPVFFSNFAPFFMETIVNTSNFEQFYRTLFPRLVQFAMAYTENEAESSVFRTRVTVGRNVTRCYAKNAISERIPSVAGVVLKVDNAYAFLQYANILVCFFVF